MTEAVYVVTAPSIGSVGPNTRAERLPVCNWCGRQPTRFQHLHLLVHRAEGLPVARLTNHLLISESMAAKLSQAGIRLALSPVTQELVEGVRGVLEPMALVQIRTTIPNRAMEHCPRCLATQSTTTAEISLFSMRQASANVAVLESDVPPDPVFWIGHDRIAVSHAVAALIHDLPEVEVREVPFVDPSQAAPAATTQATPASGQMRREDLGLPPAAGGHQATPASGQMRREDLGLPPAGASGAGSAPTEGGPLPAIPLGASPSGSQSGTGAVPPSAMPAEASPEEPVDEPSEEYDPFAPAKVSSDEHDLPPDITPVPRGGTWGTTRKRAAEAADRARREDEAKADDAKSDDASNDPPGEQAGD